VASRQRLSFLAGGLGLQARGQASKSSNVLGCVRSGKSTQTYQRSNRLGSIHQCLFVKAVEDVRQQDLHADDRRRHRG